MSNTQDTAGNNQVPTLEDLKNNREISVIREQQVITNMLNNSLNHIVSNIAVSNKINLVIMKNHVEEIAHHREFEAQMRLEIATPDSVQTYLDNLQLLREKQKNEAAEIQAELQSVTKPS